MFNDCRVDPDSALYGDMVIHKEKYGLDHILLNFTFKVHTQASLSHFLLLIIGDSYLKSYELTKTSLLAISARLFHSKLKTLLVTSSFSSRLTVQLSFPE